MGATARGGATGKGGATARAGPDRPETSDELGDRPRSGARLSYITRRASGIIFAMERTQISLEPEQADRLRRLARERGVSMAHLIREAVDAAYGPEAPDSREALWARAWSAVGCGHSGLGDVARDHDRYLDEIYGS